MYDLTTRSSGDMDEDTNKMAWGRIKSDEGWVRSEKNKIQEKTGKWERLLLRSNLGRRWIERIKEEGSIPRHTGDFVSRFKTMVKDAELNAAVNVQEIVNLIMRHP